MRKQMTACTLALLCGLAPAQEGDRPGEPQTSLPSHWQIPPAPILSPEDERKTFQLADEFLTIELFASEPMVQDPVAMDFDADGRLWVVEMRGYMPDIDGRGEKEAVGRVSILTDTNNDGRADKATIFLDQLVLPRAIKVCWGGALVAHDEKLWFAKDTNGDDVADVRELVDADYIQSGNPEHQPNGLLLALDNWIYSAKSDQRYRRVDGKWIKEKTEFRGQWGITQDDFGRLYYNVNNSQLHADLFPPNYSLRNTNFIPIHALNQRIATNQAIFTLRPNTGVNRGYRPGVLNDRGHLKEFTSACAPLVYRGNRLFNKPWHKSRANDPIAELGRTEEPLSEVTWIEPNNVFVCEPAANLIKRNVLNREDWGPVPAQFAYPDREFLASTDERFRPVWLSNAPDGSLFVADMYRGVNQHKQYMTSHLRQEVLARGLDKGIHLGRIWRVRRHDSHPRLTSTISALSNRQLSGLLHDSNGWQRDTAQRLLVERRAMEVVPDLLGIAAGNSRTRSAVHALWTIEGLVAQSQEDGFGKPSLRYPVSSVPGVWAGLLEGINQSQPVAGSHALLVASRMAEGDARLEADVLERLRNGPPGESIFLEAERKVFRLRAVLAIGGFGSNDVVPTLVSLFQRQVWDVTMAEAIVCAGAGRELSLLRAIAAGVDPGGNSDGLNLAIQNLTACVAARRDGREFIELLKTLRTVQGVQGGILRGGLQGIVSERAKLRREPIVLEVVPDDLLAFQNSPDEPVRALAASIAQVVEWPGHTVERPPVVQLRPLTGAFAQQFAEGRVVYQKACAACHGLGGEGLPSLAPPLLDSEWLTGPADRVIRIVLQGLEGPIEVGGRTYAPPAILPSMPAVDSLNDMEIAAMMSYVTRELGQSSRTNTADEVAIIRNRFANRAAPWTAAELAGEPGR